MEQHTERSDNIASLLKWNPSEYVFNPDFDLGLGDEWTVRFPLSSDTAKSSRSNSSLYGIINIFSGYIVYSMLSGRVSEVIMGIAMSGTSLIKGKI